MALHYAIHERAVKKRVFTAGVLMPVFAFVLAAASLLTFTKASAAVNVVWDGNGTTNGFCSTMQSDVDVPAGMQRWQFNLTQADAGPTWQLAAAFDLPTNPTNHSIQTMDINGGTVKFYIDTPIGAKLLSASSSDGRPDKNSQLTISHCGYHAQLQVSKTVVTTYTRDFDWTINKTVDQNNLTLAESETITVNYDVTVTKDSGTDSDWAANGSIFVENTDPFNAADGVAVTDTVSGIVDPVTVTCPSTTIAAGATMECTYGPVSLPNDDPRLNTAEATTTTTGIADGSGSAAIMFGIPTTVTDECVDISDSIAGFLGHTCVSELYEYSSDIIAEDLECGPNNILNIASLTSDDGEVLTSSVTVRADVACVLGCTLTQGYWKTHSMSFNKGKHADETWMLIGPLAEKTIFFNSTKTWHQVFWTAPAGNAYYNLAHQYMAAKLNVLSGAAVPNQVATAIATAEGLFSNPANTPTAIGKLKGNSALRAQFLSLASTLAKYNEGMTGPGHCSE